MRIVPLALKEYFVYGIPVEETILKHRDIFDFCLQLKTNSSSTPYFKHLNEEGTLVSDKLDRMTRYYIAKGKTSGTLYKKFQDGRIVGVNIGYSCNLFNKAFHLDNWDDYKIDYNFYITEANKIKNVIDDRQMYLF